MTQTPPPATIRPNPLPPPPPLPLPLPLPSHPPGRRGRRDDTRVAALPIVDHHAQARPFPCGHPYSSRVPLSAWRNAVNDEYRDRMPYTYRDIAKMIDHSMLAPSTTVGEFEAGIQLALDYDVASVCIVPSFLRRCAERLAGSDVKPSTTIGFPHGGQATAAKVAEARIALDDGALELDMVVNLHHTLSGGWDYVQSDVRAVRDETHARGAKLKVIFENCYLDDTQRIRLCEICGELGADWVKTSTGFGTSGATLDDLRLMRQHSPPSVQVKASGGVKDLDFVLAAREIGVTRCGSSRTRALLDECKHRLKNSS